MNQLQAEIDAVMDILPLWLDAGDISEPDVRAAIKALVERAIAQGVARGRLVAISETARAIMAALDEELSPDRIDAVRRIESELLKVALAMQEAS